MHMHESCTCMVHHHVFWRLSVTFAATLHMLKGKYGTAMVLFKHLYHNWRSIRTVQQQINERNGSKQGRYNNPSPVYRSTDQRQLAVSIMKREQWCLRDSGAGDLTANESTGSVSRDNRPTNSRAVFTVSRDRLLIKSRDSVQQAPVTWHETNQCQGSLRVTWPIDN